MSVDQAFLEQEIYPYLDRAAICAALKPKDKGGYFELICPGCNERGAFIYKDKFKIHCNRRNQCGYEATILTYLNGGSKPTGEAYFQVVRKLCEMTNVTYPEGGLTPEKAEAIRKAQERAESMESALLLAKSSMSQKAIKYAESRGIPRSELHALDIGTFTEIELLRDLGIDEKWIGRLVLAARDRHGRIKAFSGRLMEGEGEKYLHTKGANFQQIGAAGLDVALDKNASGTVVLVEALIDVYVWRALGYKRIAAICGPGDHLTAERLQLLWKLGVRRLILALDNDKAGDKGVERVIDNSLEVSLCPEIFVIPPSSFGIAKDPGELATNGGSLEKLEKEAIHAFRYKASAIAQRHDIPSDLGKHAYLAECIKWDEPIKDARRIQKILEYFWPEVQRISGSDLYGILDLREEIRAARLRQDQETKLVSAMKVAQSALQERNVFEAVQALQQATAFATAGPTYIEPILSIKDRLPAHTERLSTRSGQEYIGLIQDSLPEINKATLGLRKMITLAGGPGTCKTILLAQLIMDVLFRNPDACAVLVSWELTGDELLDRMKSRLTKTRWEDLQLKSTPELLRMADEALESIADRMVILEQENCPDLTAEVILREVALLKQRTSCTKVIVGVDYFQILPVPDELMAKGNEISVEKYLVREMKKIRYALADEGALIIVSEVNKNDGSMRADGLEKVKGSVRLPYASDAVFLLNHLTDEQLVTNFVMHGGHVNPRFRYAYDEEVPTKPNELKELAAEIRQALEPSGKDYLEMRIAKCRDGGRKARMFLTAHHEMSSLEQGLK